MNREDNTDTKMNILIVSHEYPPIGGGGANACLFLSRELALKGHRVEIISANFGGLGDVTTDNGVIIHRVNSARSHKDHCSFMEMLDYIKKALPLAKQLEKTNKYDICLVFFGIPSGPIGYILKKKYRLPYVIRFGGGDVPGFQERFKKVYKVISPAIKAVWRNADYLIANSKGLKDMAMNYYGKKEFIVIPNGVDTEFFSPGDGRKDDSRVNILFVSRLIERKGLQYIIPHLKEIADKSDYDIKLSIVGDGPYRGYLEEMAKQYKVEHMIEFWGHKEKNDIVPYYRNADIFILPSQKEGMPNVVLEAMACGLPIIMTPCQGAEELIDGNGFIEETDTFPDRLVEMINDAEGRARMGARSRENACNSFGWKKTADSYEKIMKESSRSENNSIKISN